MSSTMRLCSEVSQPAIITLITGACVLKVLVIVIINVFSRTILKTNISSIKLNSPPLSEALVYICLVTNNSGITVNATYKQHPLAIGRH